MTASDDGDELVLAIPPEAEAIAIARLFAAATCRQMGIDEERIDDVKVAVSEAVTNAVRAHREANETSPIRVIVRPAAKVLEVRDRGKGFEPAVSEGTMTPAAGLYEGSLGLSLIQALFPDVFIERNPDQGMTVRLALEARVARPAD